MSLISQAVYWLFQNSELFFCFFFANSEFTLKHLNAFKRTHLAFTYTIMQLVDAEAGHRGKKTLRHCL